MLFKLLLMLFGVLLKLFKFCKLLTNLLFKLLLNLLFKLLLKLFKLFKLLKLGLLGNYYGCGGWCR